MMLKVLSAAVGPGFQEARHCWAAKAFDQDWCSSLGSLDSGGQCGHGVSGVTVYGSIGAWGVAIQAFGSQIKKKMTS